jgi:hypothetical protein
MGLPKDVKDTGKKVLGLHTYTSESIPDCNRCLVMSGTHAKTGETGWFAFCKKSMKLEKVGPYETFNKALKTLALTKGCDSCEFNKYEAKSSFLSTLNEKIEEEMRENFEGNIFSIYTGPVQTFVKNRKYFDLRFESKFKTRFFKPLLDDCVATVDSIKPCENEEQFSMKVQALAGMIDRIEESKARSLIKNKKGQTVIGSINILEEILKENTVKYPKHAVQNLRNLMSLRNMYPAHATTARILVVLQNFGIANYPLKDWGKGWRRILTLCANNLGELADVLQ